ncbi:related to UPF0587 protein YCR090C [Saccharomycodes ludwigii]|uniref:Related to UPF0587 protein YCR090C n=1 Tax=Saccharomycodes ludwigii TaxID=36035 RepID=A0A376B2M9_9ASCO|nr:hypothetical protein SCDLUD_003769 [Saccharomycodes ludwigii]KAH3900764.1 hypothetical protein SCDLUD_003769 [Saccharomycodes ludwigii]SSD58927.1 related to UPF0587 protein YCR090C [Saccharomycodes ludwigii]
MLYLTVKAILSENIKSFGLKSTDTPSTPVEYPFKVKCTSCNEINESLITINNYEKHEVNNGKGEVSFIFKCKFCGNPASIIMNNENTELLFNDCDENQDLIESQLKKRGKKIKGIKNKATLKDTSIAIFLQFDCRGCEIIQFIDDNVEFGVTLFSNNSEEIPCILDEGEWYDYDEKSEQEISITEVEWNIISGK